MLLSFAYLIFLSKGAYYKSRADYILGTLHFYLPCKPILKTKNNFDVSAMIPHNFRAFRA